MSADVRSLRVDPSRSSRRGALGAGSIISNSTVAGAPGKGYTNRRVEARNEGVISIGASSHEQRAAGSGQADSASTSP